MLRPYASRHPSFLSDLLDPYPGRASRAVEIACACTLVVLVVMTYGMPDPALSTYLIFFVAKENSGQSIVTAVVFLIAITLALSAILGLVHLTANAPATHPLVIAAVAFVFFFLAVGSKLAPLAGTLGLVVADGLYKLGSVPLGEAQTRGLLYTALFAGTPLLVFIAYSLAFGRHPETVLRREIGTRLRTIARALDDDGWDGRERVVRALDGGNAPMLTALKMIGLLHRQPKDTQARLRRLVELSFAAALVAAAVVRERAPGRHDLAARLDRLAEAVARMPRLVRPADGAPPEQPRDSTGDPAARLALLCAAMEAVVSGCPVPGHADGARPGAPASPRKGGFFAPEAFATSRVAVHAFKGAAAVTICYLTITILDWSSIGTCLVTCFIVALGSLGETTQKLVLRILGCLIGATFGLAAIVFVLPGLTSITALMSVVFLAALPAAWVAVGRPSVSYIGFQAAFAFFLCLLQGAEPKFDLTVARDRIIGILYGDVVTYAIFATIYPVSILARLRADILTLVERCHGVLAALGQGRSDLAAAAALADAEAMLDKLRAEGEAFGYEALRFRDGRLQRQATRLSMKALRALVDDLGRLAAYPPPEPGSAEEGASRAACARIEGRLGELAAELAGRGSEGGAADAGCAPTRVDLVGLRPGRAAAILSLHDQVGRVGVTLTRYRRLLRDREAARA
ncbi:FUSC family protein [Methylobacterium sp. J-070]|uniref:FUSC family protein n=1 Tax=Methylobacterium sp. J-070 TaxID=2836650 RepID=UPI001FB9AC10|nr:FUSC family protein [Methylobacterium sp. J-070]MCJ2053904.1 FUSC family protein [Methylobacterium sp. J-070]